MRIMDLIFSIFHLYVKITNNQQVKCEILPTVLLVLQLYATTNLC